MALAVAGAYAVSPLAPVGPVHRFDPARGFNADPLVLAGGGAVLALVLLALLAVLAWRAVRPAGREPARSAISDRRRLGRPAGPGGDRSTTGA